MRCIKRMVPTTVGAIVAGVIAVGGSGCCRVAEPWRPAELAARAPSERAADWPDRPDDQERLAGTDPLTFLKRCREHYFEHVDDYRCLFTIQERQGGVVGPERQMAIRFREKPFSVRMEWVKNPGPAEWISYVAGRWVDRQGREQALIKPSGVLGWLAPNGVKRYIHAPDVLAESRRPIDQFGFLNTLELVIQYCERARDHPDYDLRYVGRGLLDNRPGYFFERRLPYTGPGGPYPDRLLTVLIDREWLVPTGCISYLDDARNDLLGRYILTDVRFNTGLAEDDF